MKRTLGVLISAALLFGVVAVPANAVQGDDQVVCDQEAMSTLLTIGYDVFNGSPLLRCQFRLFISHDRPHVWTEKEYFHGGDFWFYPPNDTQEWDMSPGAVKRYFRQVEERLFWGKAGTPDGKLRELTLKRGPMLTVDWGDGTTSIVRETYFDFAPQEPGLYRWRYIYRDPFVSDDVTSEVCIARVIKGNGTPGCPGDPPIDG